jgi:hypothetical protein
MLAYLPHELRPQRFILWRRCFFASERDRYDEASHEKARFRWKSVVKSHGCISLVIQTITAPRSFRNREIEMVISHSLLKNLKLVVSEQSESNRSKTSIAIL